MGKWGRFAGRIQDGNIHSYMRGNNKKIVFYDDIDRIEFLKRCDRFAKQYDSKVLEFVLMDNHVHLQLETKKLSPMMTSLIMSYVEWYNFRHEISDKLFKSPFNSSCKFSNEWAIDSMIYILKNPVKAKICLNAADYKWSSYGFHFNGKTPLKRFIDVDTSLVDNYFGSKDFFDEAIRVYDRSNPALMIYPNEVKLDSVKKKTPAHLRMENGIFFEALPTSDLCQELNRELNGRNLFTISKEEQEEIVIKLFRNTRASFRQLSRLTNLNYDYVRRICGCKGHLAKK